MTRPARTARREREVSPAYVAIGSNVGDPAGNARDAIAALGRQDDLEVVRVSSLYETDPVGCPPGQDPYVNAVAKVRTPLDPHQLLARLGRIERDMGRVRPARRNMPRVIDLDLLLFGDETVDTPDLRVPHPRMHQRAFVLAPLAEIEPALSLPGRGRVTDLLARCDGQGVRRIRDDQW